jgi:hypothetical protein
VKLLLHKGADTNIKNKEDKAPIDLANNDDLKRKIEETKIQISLR